MSTQFTTEIDQVLKEFRRLPLEGQNRFPEQAQRIAQRDEEETARARAFLDSRELPLPRHSLSIGRKASLIRFLQQVGDIPRHPIDESKLSDHNRVL